jgi:phytoene dehydrogenase-like protein
LTKSAKKRAVVIGSGPNGLSAAILLAQAGHPVTVYEAAERIGGGTRSEELTLPGFLHDVCSTILPMAAASPAFERLPLEAHGLEMIHPDAPLAHPMDDGSAVMQERSIRATAANLGEDGAAWRGLMEPLAANWPYLRESILAPMVRVPRHPLRMARFGLLALRPARALAESLFRGPRARALFAGIAAHSVVPLENPGTAAAGLVLGALAHTEGWPFPRGGAQKVGDALAGYLRALGGEIVTGTRLESLPEEPLVMCDVGPRQLLALAGNRLPDGYRGALERFRYGPGAFKMDWALDGPIPWRARECARAGTVHVGGTLEEIAAWESRFEGAPFVLIAQTTLFDTTRAPEGKHTAWGYCHVPNGSAVDMTQAIEDQMERFAPGFRSRILGRHVMGPAELEGRNPNLVGGDFSGGANDLRQLMLRLGYSTPLRGVYLCSASTPPGGGVHGMCGYHAARTALRRG